MQSRHKAGLTLITGVMLGVIMVLAFIFFKSNSIIVLKMKEENRFKNTKTAFSKNKSYKATPKRTYPYYTNSKVRNQYLDNEYYPEENKAQLSANKESKPVYVDEVTIDLNTADTLDLQMIRGIGKVFARNIYNYGKRLGGYTSKEQLKEVWGINDTVFAKISPHIVLQTKEVRKININTDNIKHLSSHPYIDYYLAKAIIQFRQQYGDFQNIEDIKRVHLMTEDLYKKLAPYLATK